MVLPLAVAVLIVNLPAIHGLGWPRYVLNCLIWLTTLAILVHDPQMRGRREDSADAAEARRRERKPLLKLRSDRTILAALGVVALLSLLSYYDFGRFHGGGRFVHYHDLYHYYMGSKYFPEVGYEGLYAATHRALVENQPAMSGGISLVKNLRTYDIENARISWQRSDGVTARFSDSRWEQFKHDVRFFQARLAPAEWQVLLVDHGFNATPFWTGVGAALSSRLPLNSATLLLLALIDPLLVAAALVLVWLTFDARTGLLAVIFLCANFFGVFDITGGAFLRQLWLAALIGFVCCYRRGWMWPAAALLAVAALDRVFPAVFALPAAVLLIIDTVRRRSAGRVQARFLAAFVAFAAGLGLTVCLTVGGPRSWTDWYDKISAHNRWFYTNQLSLRNLFTVNPAQSLRTISEGWNEGLWLRERETLDARTRNTLLAGRTVLLGLLIATVAKRKDALASLALVSFVPLVLFYPADYYCVFLVAAILCWRGNRGLALALVGLQALFWLVNIPLSSGVCLELLHWVISLCLIVVFVVFLGRELLNGGQDQRARRKAPLPLLAGAAAILLAGFVADTRAARRQPLPFELDLTPDDVLLAENLQPGLEHMASWGNAWSRNDHLLCVTTGAAARAVVRVPAPSDGMYSLAVTYSTGPPFGIVTLAINGEQPISTLNLYAPNVGVRTEVYDEVALKGGDNEFSFAVTGKDRAAKDQFFAVDTIKLDYAAPREASSSTAACRAALERALAWLMTHPADCFDGGRPAICKEIAVLHSVMSTPQLAEWGSKCMPELQQRIERLNTDCGPRLHLHEYDGMLLAGHVARQFNLEFIALAPVAEQLKPWIESVYADRSAAQLLFAGEYFNRLYPEQAVAINVEQSLVYREYSERKLAQVLAGDVDRNKTRAVMATISALSQDVCGLTDFGRLAPPAGYLADQEFWGRLCEDGLRWSMQTGDLLTLARVIQLAECLRVAGAVPGLPAAVDLLVEHQRGDGSFGAITCDNPNPYREGVLNAALALKASLR